MEQILTFLDGKKAIIFGIVNAINTYLVTAQIYSPEIGSLIATVIALLSGGAVYATNQSLGRAKRSKFN